MSLHINLLKNERMIAVDVALSFLTFFQTVLRAESIKGYVSGDVAIFEMEVKDNQKIRQISQDIKLRLDNDIDIISTNIDFNFSIGEVLGCVSVKNSFDSKIFGDIEVDVFPSKCSVRRVETFFDLLSAGILTPEQLDNFFSFHKQVLRQAYIDLNEEGADNPLDVLYEYSSQGRVFFMNILKVVELLSEEDERFIELYNKIRTSDKNYVSSRLWNDSKIKEYAFELANQHNVVAAEGSFKLHAEDKEQLKKFYENMVDNILNPIFMDIPSIDEKISQVALSISSKN
ncbi:hypothetical protein HY772_01825 [Candidatus Woesearchaeota archaeon]|nr:hypothetical protein [Candidatus Woesearchaeota archaeon]